MGKGPWGKLRPQESDGWETKVAGIMGQIKASAVAWETSSKPKARMRGMGG